MREVRGAPRAASHDRITERLRTPERPAKPLDRFAMLAIGRDKLGIQPRDFRFAQRFRGLVAFGFRRVKPSRQTDDDRLGALRVVVRPVGRPLRRVEPGIRLREIGLGRISARTGGYRANCEVPIRASRPPLPTAGSAPAPASCVRDRAKCSGSHRRSRASREVGEWNRGIRSVLERYGSTRSAPLGQR